MGRPGKSKSCNDVLDVWRSATFPEKKNKKKNSNYVSVLLIANTDRTASEHSTSHSLADISWTQKATLQLYWRNMPLLHMSRYDSALPVLASYPVLLIPAFVTCSINAGEGLVLHTVHTTPKHESQAKQQMNIWRHAHASAKLWYWCVYMHAEMGSYFKSGRTVRAITSKGWYRHTVIILSFSPWIPTKLQQ